MHADGVDPVHACCPESSAFAPASSESPAASFSTEIGPNMDGSPAVLGVRRRHLHHARREPVVAARDQDRGAAGLGQPDAVAVGDAERRHRGGAEDGGRRPGVAGQLQAARAAHQRIGEVDRHVGQPLQRRRSRAPAAAMRCRRPGCSSATRNAGRRPNSDCGPWRGSPAAPAPARARRCRNRSPGTSSGVADHPQHLPAGPRLAARPRNAVESLEPPFAVDEGAAGFRERRDRQQAIGQFQQFRRPVGGQRDHRLRPGPGRPWPRPDRRNRASARCPSAGRPARGCASMARALRPLPPRSRQGAGQVATDRIGSFADDAEARPGERRDGLRNPRDLAVGRDAGRPHCRAR